VTVVSDSSPLITLARISCLDLLPKLYGRIYISTEVYNEVVIAGAGLPGAAQAAQAGWIEVRPVQNTANLVIAIDKIGLGSGEVSAVVLAKELKADLVLIDERKARGYAREEGLAIIGCVGILEDLYEQGDLDDLRVAYQKLIQHKTRIDLQTLQFSLLKFKLPPLQP
jgi:predicted nucleic acid-binding protein